MLKAICTFALTMGLASASAAPNSIAFGDSIAFGTGHALGLPTVAVVGASSCTILSWVPKRGMYNHVVLSAGINDSGACVLKIRAAIPAQQVIWILPAPINGAREKVQAAIRPGDRVVSYECKGGCTKTNFHPRSYPEVAASVRSMW